MKKIVALLLVAVLAVALVACGGEKANVVTMGTNAAFEPFEFIEGEEIVGIDPETYYTATQGIIVAEDSDIKGIDDIVDKRVGAITGYTGEVICAEDYKIAGLVTFKRGVDAVMELKNGKLDAVVIDLQPAKMFVNSNEGLKVIEDPSFAAEEYAIAVKKGNTELLNAINEVIAELKATGKLDEIINKYQNK